MEFKRPADKCGSLNSPTNKKKLRTSLLSTTIASPEIRKQETNSLFDDNFSQFFQSQFIRQITDVEKGFERKETELNNSQLASGTAKLGNYSFTQCVGFSQTLNESQFEDTIPLGQQSKTDQTDINSHQQLASQCLNDFPVDVFEPDELISEQQQQLIQSSQFFLNEVAALHLSITSMIDETLCANKLNTSDNFDTNPKKNEFDLYTSIITQSEYMQLKRPENVEKSRIRECSLNEMNEALEDQLLAEFEHNEMLNDSEKLNECIDPDSSAIASLLNDDDDYDFLFNNTFESKINEVGGSVIKGSENWISEKTKLVAPDTPKTNKIKQEPIVANNKPVTAAYFCKLGSFFDLPPKVKSLIKEFKQIDDLYDWQKECLKLPAIDMKQNLVYALPTSGGKTLVSEILILRELLCRRKNCLFILPYVSIVQEKVWALSPFALHLDFLVEEYAAGKGTLPPRKRRKKNSVYIATIEKALALFDSLIESNRANEIGLVVVDELHIVGECGRGAVLESLLTKIQYVKAGIQIVGMSATIGNLKELAQFLNADIYHKDFRPVELREYIKCGSDLLEIKKDASSLENAFERDRTVSFGYNEEVQRADPDHIAGLVSEVIPEESCLIFCPSKKNCENLSTLLCNILSKKYIQHKKTEKENLIKAIENDIGSPICSILGKTIMYGIAYHHSGLTADERRHLEDAFRLGILCVICCTSTLAAGVNLPAKRVIIRSPYVGKEFITLSKYKQMVGRAGRAGYGAFGESILICAARDNNRVMQLLCSPMDEVISQMQSCEARALETLILSSIGLEVASTRSELQKLVSSTLFSVQATRLEYDLKKVVDDIIANLLKSKSITVTVENKSTQSSQNHSFNKEVILSQKTIFLKPSTKLEVSMMGKSSFKSGIDLKRAKIVHKELLHAQRSLVLLDYFHLLFMVTPFDDNNVTVMPDRQIFYNKYTDLSENQVHTARIIGINETIAFKLMAGQTLKVEQERLIKKFFLTMVLNELWHLKPVSEIAISFQIDRGIVQNLMGMAAIEASCLLKYCEEIEEFWAFRELFKNLSQRLSNICTVELVPLMDLPCVKMGRAKQLYAAGYKKVEDIAKAKATDLVANIEHMNNRVANQLISAAKVIVLEKLENLREEVQECMDAYAS